MSGNGVHGLFVGGLYRLHPAFDALGIADSGHAADRIEEDDDHRFLGKLCLHHQASSVFADIADLGDSHLSASVVHQGIGVAIEQSTPVDVDFAFRIGGEVSSRISA